MRCSRNPAPACSRWGLAGVTVFALAGTALLAAACDRPADEAPATLELEADTIQLAAGVRLLSVTVSTRPDGGEFDPELITARTGDVVRFTAGDARMHALAFSAAALAPEARAFLEGTHQLRGPPMVTVGTQWVIDLDGAPPGSYPLTCTTHGASGRLVVSARTRP